MDMKKIYFGILFSVILTLNIFYVYKTNQNDFTLMNLM
jgi:hypothetical protein